MHFMAGPAGSRSLGPLGLHSTPEAQYLVLLVLVMMSLVFGKFDLVNQEPPHPAQSPKYLRCYRCLLETKELGCLLGSDICLVPPGSGCRTLFIKNSSGSDIMVSDCRSKEQLSDCSYTRPSPVFGFWIFSQCCFLDFCNNPQNRAFYIP
ncbi:PREDICTED: lymphocyte antigen 6 complex locus protein G5c [Ceratotherium simum simum]|uniref:Lymphocyte antigen 6 complex locus protein G5c n=1 Tax=Ceratotherium simum simum TaxID=73337 RepID=A0ABM0HCX4_CERSS|nr:PREDICTED: lymphocyte antigen 6 complex locus protein G5c [Ceratotherium simum simum]